MSIEEIKNLVRLEKEVEGEIKKANESAANLIEKADEEAHKILQEAEDQKYYDGIFKKKIMEIEEKRDSMERQSEEKIKQLREIADKNLEKTISLIIKFLLGE